MTVTALDLEQIMLHPRCDEILAAIRAGAPVAARDQADAAISHTRELAVGVADLIGLEPAGCGRAQDVPPWLRLLLLDALRSFADGEASTCQHGPHPSSPEPVLAAAWKPGLVTCGRCTHLFSVGRGSDRDRTCDCCGRICQGNDEDPIYPGMIGMSVLLFQYGVCRDCKPPTVGISPQSTATVAVPPMVAIATPDGEVMADRLRTRPRGSRGRGRGRR